VREVGAEQREAEGRQAARESAFRLAMYAAFTRMHLAYASLASPRATHIVVRAALRASPRPFC